MGRGGCVGVAGIGGWGVPGGASGIGASFAGGAAATDSCTDGAGEGNCVTSGANVTRRLSTGLATCASVAPVTCVTTPCNATSRSAWVVAPSAPANIRWICSGKS